MADAVTNVTKRTSHPPTVKLTTRQLFYVSVVHGVGSLALGGGINFAIATAMYRWVYISNQHAVALSCF